MKNMMIYSCIFCCLVGCSSDDNVNLRFVNSSPDAPELDLVVDDDREFRGVLFSSATDYVEQSSGEKEFEIRPANTTSNLSTFDFDLSSDTNYTIIASDYLSEITPLILVDDSDNPGEDTIKLRIVHASPTGDAVDIYASDPSVSIVGLEPIVTNLQFGQSSDYIELPAGSYRIRVTRTGGKVALVDKGSTTLKEEEIYTAILQDRKDGGRPLGINILNDTRASEDTDDN